MLSGDKGPKMTAALKQLDNSITDLHSAGEPGDQKEAQSASQKSKPLLMSSNLKILTLLSKVCSDLESDGSQPMLFWNGIQEKALAEFSVVKQIFEEKSFDVVRAAQIL